MLDLTRFFFGEPSQVYSVQENLFHKNLADYTVEDASATTVRFHSGALAVITATNGAIPNRWDCDWRVFMPGLAADFNDANHATFQYTGQPWASAVSVSAEKDMYRAETLDLLQAIQDDRPAQVPIEEGVRSLCFALAATEFRSNQRTGDGRVTGITRKEQAVEVNSREKIDLGGTWQIAFDPENVGVQQKWSGENYPEHQAGPVEVPGIWNLTYPDMQGVAYYRTTFTVPASWHGKAILLDFEGAIYTCQAWVDGQFAGSHEGGYTPFWFDVSNLVKPGSECVLIVRVAVPSKKQEVDGIILEQAPLSKHSWYYVYGGLWGHVSLTALAETGLPGHHG